MTKILVMSDQQIPFQDPVTADLMVDFAKTLQPDVIVHAGDLLDFPDLTTKYHRRTATYHHVDEEIGEAQAYVERFGRAVPGVIQRLTPGNHEARLELYVEEQADALAPLLDGPLSLQTLLGPQIEVVGSYLEGTAVVQVGGLRIMHGYFHGKNAAEQHYRRYGSTVFGHVHRPVTYAESNADGDHMAWGIGCMCNTAGPNKPPAKASGSILNYTQGFAVVAVDDETGVYTVHNVPIIDHAFVWVDGQRYG